MIQLELIKFYNIINNVSTFYSNLNEVMIQQYQS